MRKLKRFARKKKALILRAFAALLPMMFAMMLLSQTAFAKNTYVITDGSRVLTYTTYATDPETVLGEVGLTLDADDTYTTQSGLTNSQITVRRSQSIRIDHYGEEMTATSNGETVEALLTRLNIPMTEGDTVNFRLDDITFDGMCISIDKVIRQDQTYTSTIAHGTRYCYDASLPVGMEEVVTQGVDGELLCTATVTYVNGTETGRTLLSQSVSIPAVEEVVAVGTGLASPRSGEEGMPVIGDGTITLATGEVLTYTDMISCEATAYYTRGTTATGTTARYGAIAVDPRVIPYGTRMFIVTDDGEYIYGIATAEDCGDPNFIGGNRIDLWYPTEWDCIQFGFRECSVYILGAN